MADEPARSKSLVVPMVAGILGGGVAGFAIYYVLNNFVQIGGRGWLDRLIPGPARGWMVLAAAGAAIGGIANLVKGVRERARVASMGEFASSLGMAYEPTTDPARLGIDEKPLISSWTSGEHWYRGDYRGLPCDVVDVMGIQEEADSDGERSIVERTVALLPGEGLPDLDLGPRRFAHRVLAAMGAAGVEFDPSGAATAAEAEAIGEFVRTWHLAAGDPPRATVAGGARSPEDEANEAAVRRMFTPLVMERLGPFAGWSARARGGRLAIWNRDKFLAPSARADLLDGAFALRGALLGGLDSAPGAVVPAPSAEMAGARSRRLAGTSLGGVIGTFLGFFGGFALFISNFFKAKGAVPATSFLFPLSVFGGAALGALVGAGLGRLAAPLIKLPKLPLAPNSAARPSGWAPAGMFLGFILGGACGIGLVVGLHRLLGLNIAPPWVILPLFFGCPIFGMVGGWILGSRFAARRDGRRAP